MGNSLKNKNIVIGVTGSIACYKVLDLIKRLKKLNSTVYVIMTESATKLVSVSDFENVADDVKVHLFDPNFNYKDYIKKNRPIKHISFADVADLFLICPATANVIAKIANGISDDLLTSSILATLAPVVICPAMNVKMWNNPLTQENVAKLRKLGYIFVEPEYGDLACGYKGIGRLANLDKISNRITTIINKKNSLKNKKILVTAGATIEEIDPVRVITNKSSGKMGVYIAEEAFLRGADVTLVRGANAIEPKFPIRDIKVSSAEELFNEIKKNIKDKDIMIHAAAVSDFEVNNKRDEKIKSGQELHLELTPTTKILENIKILEKQSFSGRRKSKTFSSEIKKNIFLVGFKAEYNVSEKVLVERAYNLLKDANADLMIANDVGKKGRGFDVETNEVFIVDKNRKVKHLDLADKKIIASKVLDEIKIR
ncbi:bifunctional phosphopantothenoylcysteine decarboxylase/phosphopantothenate--cysteine ligase CoaBC [Candidatus Woesearchaeota archaeon]|nr:bifunctional phosphopantothenoylcysteine decarboxylase/phosphopantothenate--cysteine ligase CoaBC [Candidatus Woesearchaeota archaeon]